MVERTRKGLTDLLAEACAGIIGQPMILTMKGGEFGLKKQPAAPDSLLRKLFQRVPDLRLIVMDELIGRINRRKAGFDGLEHQ
jgi:hypothetical protein